MHANERRYAPRCFWLIASAVLKDVLACVLFVGGFWKVQAGTQANIACSPSFYGWINTFTRLGFGIYTKKTIIFKKN